MDSKTVYDLKCFKKELHTKLSDIAMNLIHQYDYEGDIYFKMEMVTETEEDNSKFVVEFNSKTTLNIDL